MRIRDRLISPGAPWQNGTAERGIGTLRRERLDQVMVLVIRTCGVFSLPMRHIYSPTPHPPGIAERCAARRAVQRSGSVAAVPVLGALHHEYVRI
jgi:transposase InsO family protein